MYGIKLFPFLYSLMTMFTIVLNCAIMLGRIFIPFVVTGPCGPLKIHSTNAFFPGQVGHAM
jgi:hypothetical protein